MRVELKLPDHPPVPCLSWRHHVHTELTRDRTTGEPRVPGRSRHEPFRLTRLPDAATPALLHACAAGRRISAVEVAAFGGDPEEERLRFILSDVLVTSVLCSVEDTGPLETIDLSYGAITWTWSPDAVTRAWSVFEERR